MILKHILASTRYLVLLAVAGTLLGSISLLVYELLVVGKTFVDAVRDGVLSPKSAKTLAVGLIEAVDVFLIAIAVYITGLGLFSLFVDDSLPLPKWLAIHDLDDLKSNLVSVVIAVLAVLFLREAVMWDDTHDLPGFGIALAVIIIALTFFLSKKGS